MESGWMSGRGIFLLLFSTFEDEKERGSRSFCYCKILKIQALPFFCI